MMPKTVRCLGALLATALLNGTTLNVNAQDGAESEIRAALTRLVVGYEARDIPAIMENYAPDEELTVFDVTPPLRFVGVSAYKKGYEEFYAAFPGPVKVGVAELHITAVGDLGYSHEIDTWTVTDKKGTQITFTARETYVFCKLNDRWLIVHEHASVPSDILTGKAELNLKP